MPPCTILSTNGRALVLDAGDPNLSLKLPRYTVDAILLSHFHRGHMRGLENLEINKHQQLGVYCPPDQVTLPSLRQKQPQLEFRITHPGVSQSIGEATVTPVLLNHGSITYGYCIEVGGFRIGYLCDTCGLPPQTEEWLRAWSADALLIDCNHPPGSHRSDHNTPEQAFAIHEHCRARVSYLTHIGCAANRWFDEHHNQIPSGVLVARDGMVAELGNAPQCHRNVT
jgi:phosphoribosyl 1,2-cyclic phosphate phosphodiesterase